jgi:hypothetical protein
VPKNHCEKTLKASRHIKRVKDKPAPKPQKQNKTKQKAKIFPGSLQKKRLEQREAKQIEDTQQQELDFLPSLQLIENHLPMKTSERAS